MGIKRSLLANMAWTWVLTLVCLTSAHAQEKVCLECHDDIAKKVVSHKSCTGCHANQTARSAPHGPAGKSAREIAAAGPGMCMSCHDKKLFQGKMVHGPVAAGQCLLCHDNHASDQVALLKMNPVELCLDCHPDVKTSGHRLSQFSNNGHPLGNGNRQLDDPSRPGKKFYCASCHEPHRSDRIKLTRYGREMDSCMNCHKM